MPLFVTEDVITATESPADVVENADNLAENQEANTLVPAENFGNLGEDGLVDADVAADVVIDEEEEKGRIYFRVRRGGGPCPLRSVCGANGKESSQISQ